MMRTDGAVGGSDEMTGVIIKVGTARERSGEQSNIKASLLNGNIH